MLRAENYEQISPTGLSLVFGRVGFHPGER
jgi:hypothetical protein